MKQNNLTALLLFLLAAVAALIAVRYCNREKIAEPRIITQSEAQRQGMVTRDTLAAASYRADTARMGSENRALRRELLAATSKDKQQAEKARHSAATFAKSGKVEDCRQALADCQGENDTKAYSIVVQNRMLAAADSTQKRDRQEIGRQRGVLDSAFTGWGQANEALRKEKGKRFVLSAGVGVGITPKGLQPNVGLQVGWIIKRF